MASTLAYIVRVTAGPLRYAASGNYVASGGLLAAASTRASRAFRCSSDGSSMRMGMVHPWPDGSMTHAVRSPPKLIGRRAQNLGASRHGPLDGLVHILDIDEQHDRRGAIELRRSIRHVRPLGFDHDHRRADGQERVCEFPVLPGPADAFLGFERLLDEIDRRRRVAAHEPWDDN